MNSDLIKRDRAPRAIAIAETKEAAYDTVSGIDAEQNGIDILEEIDEALCVNVKLIVDELEDSEFNAGRKDAFKDISRMIRSYLEDLYENRIPKK